MGKAGDVLLRQWVMLRLIPTEPHMASTTQIRDRLATEGYETTARTVQRDLDELSAQFGYTNELQGRTNFWFWPRHTRPIEIPAMEPSTAAAIAMLGDHLSGMLPPGLLTAMKPYIDRSREVIASTSDHPYVRWRNKVRAVGRGPVLQAPSVSAGVFDTVCHSLLKERCISVVYVPRGATQSKSYLLHPIGLVLRDGVYYLVATAWDYDDIRQYTLHRMSKAELSENPGRKPKGFDLDKYLVEEQGLAYPLSDKLLRLQILMHPDVAVHVEERPLAKDQTVKRRPDGQVQIDAHVADTMELRWWLLGLGRFVTVLKPAGLRKEIKDSLRDSFNNYSG